MIQSGKGWVILLWIALFCQVSLPAFAGEDQNLKIMVSGNYEAGKYGTNTVTETVYIPVTIKSYFDRGDLSLTLPYIRQRSIGGVTVVNGTVFKISQQAGTAVVINSGPGDLILKGSFYILEESKNSPFDLSLVGKVKIPTADDKKGLGTGQFDETAGVEFSKMLSSNFAFLADGYYTYVGNPPGITFQNQTAYDAGFSFRLDSDLRVSLYYEESTPLQSGYADLKDLLVSFDYRLSKEVHFMFGGEKGLTDSSPDYGVNAGISVRF